jgi:hypothetical protein
MESPKSEIRAVTVTLPLSERGFKAPRAALPLFDALKEGKVAEAAGFGATVDFRIQRRIRASGSTDGAAGRGLRFLLSRGWPFGVMMFTETAPLPCGSGNSFGSAVVPGRKNVRRWYMSFALLMWSVWAVLVVITAVLYIYRGRLQRDEEDQIFLDDSFEQEKAAQEAIIAQVGKVDSPLRIMKWLVSIATALVAVYYIWDVITQFK